MKISRLLLTFTISDVVRKPYLFQIQTVSAVHYCKCLTLAVFQSNGDQRGNDSLFSTNDSLFSTNRRSRVSKYLRKYLGS